MSENGLSFDIIPSGDKPNIITPLGETVDEPWWDEATQPDSFISLEKATGLITQIAEEQGKQSCFLTAQLNALVLRGTLTVEEAGSLQSTLATDIRFSGYWRDQAAFGRDYTSWSGKPHDTAYAITAVTGKRIAMTVRHVEDAPALLRLLDEGYVVVIGDERHSRTAFKPAGSELPYVFDPKYPEATGFYESASLPQLQTDPHVVVI